MSLSDNAQKIMEMVESMTILELNELVKAMEEKFGVSASAPVMVAGAAPVAGASAAASEQDEFDVILSDAGANKIAVIKAVREIDSSLGLPEAKAFVESAPKTLKEGVKKEEAEKIKKKLEEAGAKVELK